MELLLRMDPKLMEKVDFHDENTLHVAAYGSSDGHNRTMQLLLAANPALAEGKHQSALHIAAGWGSINQVETLLAANPKLLQTRDCDHKTPLGCAAARGRIDIVRMLLEREEQQQQEQEHGGLCSRRVFYPQKQRRALEGQSDDLRSRKNCQKSSKENPRPCTWRSGKGTRPSQSS